MSGGERAVPTSQAISASGAMTERSITMFYEKPKTIEENGDTTVNLKALNSYQQPLGAASSKRKRDNDDEDELFCLSLVPNLKRLTPRNKAIAKMRFQQALFELEFPLDQLEQS